ncbi:hypothetical protein ACSHWB_44845 [Lentzea sp. HUAS TT2]|uniref:hypothetical protein n=1 Tax=Lentzea sp. HUAS TT2 TaxID=3447454 RepID=UPI003F6F6B6C
MGGAEMRAWSWSWTRALTGAALSAAVVGVPTDVIDNPWFTRMTEARWWELPVLVLTAALTAVWAGISPGVRQGGAGSVRAYGGSLLSALAVGCPVCNKIVMALLGVSGALGIWAPLQPLLALASLAALATAVVVRWRRRECATAACSPAGA